MLVSSKILYTILSLSLIMISTSCKNSKSNLNSDDKVLVKFANDKLTQTDIDMIVPNFDSPIDSASFVDEYINTWLADKLVYAEAKKKLKDISKIEAQINNYRELLYTREYYNKVLFSSMQTKNIDDEVNQYYNRYLSHYKLDSIYVKAYYLCVSANLSSYYNLLMKVREYSLENKQELLDMCLGTDRQVYFKDSWTDLESFSKSIAYNNLEFLEYDVLNNLSKPFSYIVDDLRYIVRVDSVVNRGEVAPLEIVRNQVVQIVLNNRKKDLIIQKKRELLEQAEKSNLIIKNIN